MLRTLQSQVFNETLTFKSIDFLVNVEEHNIFFYFLLKALKIVSIYPNYIYNSKQYIVLNFCVKKL